MPHPVYGMRSKWANRTDQPMAMGAKLPAIDFFETAVMHTVQTKRNVPSNSITNAEPSGNSLETKFDPNRKGGAAED